MIQSLPVKNQTGKHQGNDRAGFHRVLCLIAGFLLLVQASVWAGPTFTGTPSPPELKLSLRSLPAPLTSPGKGTLLLKVDVPSGYHIFAGEAISIRLSASPGLSFGNPEFPAGEKEGKDRVYREANTIKIPVTLKKGLAGKVNGTLFLDWQGCQDFGDRVCFLPQESKLEFSVETKAAKKSVTSVPKSVTKPPEGKKRAESMKVSILDPAAIPKQAAILRKPTSAAKPVIGGEAFTDRFKKAAKGNLPLALLLAFLLGILSSLTPCVYPIIPVTVAYIGSKSEGKGRLHGFFLSLSFVLGLAAVYSAIGTFSAKAGEAFGSITQTPWVGIPIAIFFFALALSMFNLFELKTPAFITNRVESTKQKRGGGFTGAFIIGALSGLVASPCIGPLILAILVVVAATGSALLGFLYLFVFALGMGVLFLVIGTFSGIVASLPKSGGWMDGVRVFFGALIMAAAFYFAGLYLPRPLYLVLAGVGLGFTAGFLLFGAAKHFLGPKLRLTGVLLCVVAFLGAGVLLPPPPAVAATAPGNTVWRQDLGAAEKEARTADRPMLIDFRADWCVACLELERKTWPAPEVKPILSELIPVKMDMTKKNDENKAILQRFAIKGLPTVILLAPGGRELGRFTGFKSPANTAGWLKGFLKKKGRKK